MKAQLLIDQEGPNPAFDADEYRRCKRLKVHYGISPKVIYPAGTIIDHPDVWIHCCKSRPTHAPADAECADKVKAWLGHPARKALLAKFKTLAQPAVLEKAPRWLKQYVASIVAKWGDQIEAVDADPDAKPEDIAAAIEELGGKVPSDDDLSDEELEGLTNPFSDLNQ